MDDPIQDIEPIILKLCTGSPRVQKKAIDDFFTPNSTFTHPFCSATGRRYILSIFQWYKILSPHVDITINSIAFDETNLILYVNISQIFRIWFVPFYKAPVTLTTVLHLTRHAGAEEDALNSAVQANGFTGAPKHKYYIQSQNDLYQVDQFIRFVLPLGGALLVAVWHLFATVCCVLGAYCCFPITHLLQWLSDQRFSGRGGTGPPQPPLARIGNHTKLEGDSGEHEVWEREAAAAHGITLPAKSQHPTKVKSG